jgi:hypothetical protein
MILIIILIIGIVFRKYLSSITGKHEVKEVQKTVYWAQHTYCGKC